MTNQKLVLEQIGALNTTTAGMIDSTGEMLRTQSAAIHEQAASSTIPLETLQRAFQNIYDTMDQIDQFKLKALDNMKQTVETLGTEVEKIARLHRPRRRRRAGPDRRRQVAVDADRDQMSEVTDKVDRAIARFERVTASSTSARVRRAKPRSASASGSMPASRRTAIGSRSRAR